MGGDRSCRIWRCAGCGAEQLGLRGWQQLIFPPAPSERFHVHLRDREHTIVCGQRACAMTVRRQWARRLGPQALAAAEAEGLLEALSRPLIACPEVQWAALVRLSLGTVLDGRRSLSSLGSRVVELAKRSSALGRAQRAWAGWGTEERDDEFQSWRELAVHVATEGA